MSLARDNRVDSVGREDLKALVESHPVTITDVAAEERRRMVSLR